MPKPKHKEISKSDSHDDFKALDYKPRFIFEKKNYIVMLIGLIFLIVGFALMSGGGSDDPEVFNPDVFNWRRVRLAPIVVVLGFAIELYAILLNPDASKTSKK